MGSLSALLSKARLSAVATVLLLMAFGASPACSSDDSKSTATTCTPDLAGVQAIFAKSCTKSGCHAGTAPAASLDLASDGVEGRLSGIAAGTCSDSTLRVTPGDPDHSLLFLKVSSDNPPCGGARMPLGGQLSAGEITCIRGWIASLSPTTDAGADVSLSDGGPDSAVDGSADALTCANGLSDCAGACVDTQSDNANCGGCGQVCGAGQTCSAGSCACTSGQTECGGACVDVQSDVANCGSCGKACPTGATCAGGACSCPSGQTECGGACVDLTSDGNHCGACGTVCTNGDVCANGTCSQGCGTLTTCGTSCVDLNTNIQNCGSCGTTCATGGSCVNGSCQCPSGSKDCNGVCTDTTSSSQNCGSCGVTCSGGSSCQNSACACPSGQQLCSGVCTAVDSDPQNCGTCGTVCGGAQTCQSGSCQCPGGKTACSGSCVDTQTDPQHCGACGVACGTGAACTSGACGCEPVNVSFASQVQPIFTANCAAAGCHTGAMPQEGMNLSAGKAYSNIVNVTAKQCGDGRKRVLPGNADQSYLIDKLLGVDLCFGTKMPKLGSISNAEIQTVAAWICSGAPNN